MIRKSNGRAGVLGMTLLVGGLLATAGCHDDNPPPQNVIVAPAAPSTPRPGGRTGACGRTGRKWRTRSRRSTRRIGRVRGLGPRVWDGV